MTRARPWILVGLALVACLPGLLVWAQGGGAAMLVVVAMIIGVGLSGGRLGYPAATAVVVIWTLAAWTVTGEAIRMGPPSATLWNGVLLGAAFLPILVGLVVRLAFPDGAVRLAWDLRRRPAVIVGALAGAVAMLGTVGIAAERYGVNGMAWAMSGDARNTMQSALDVFPSVIGGQGIATYPMMALYSALAVVGSRPDSTGEPGTATLDHAITTLAAFECGVIALMTIASAGLLIQVMGARRVPLAAVVGASLAPLLGLGIGIGLQDGFVSAFPAIVIVTLSMTLAAVAADRGCSPGIRFLMAATIVVAAAVLLFTWAFVIVAVVPLLVLVVLWSWRTSPRWMRLVAIGAAVVAGLGLASFMPEWIRNTLENHVFALSGAIVAPSPWLLVLIPVFFGACALWQGQQGTRRILLAATFSGLAVAGMVAFICYSADGPPGYPYYAAKLTWIWSASVLGLAFVPVAFAFSADGGLWVSGRPRLAASAVGAVLLTVLVLIGVRFASPVESPLLAIQPMPFSTTSPIVDGWLRPSVGTVGIARRAAEVDNAVVFGATDPGDERLANFWLNLVPTNRANDFKGWADLTAGDMASLCDLLNRDPSRTVITANPDLAGTIRTDCGIPNPRVVILG